MEIIASDLERKLSILNNLVSENGAAENCDKFIFSSKAITAFDGEIFVSVLFSSGLNGAVDGKSFYNAIKKFKTDSIDVVTENDSIILKKKKSKLKLLFERGVTSQVDLDDIPDWNSIPNGFVDALNTCSYTCGKDYSDLRTICIRVNKDVCESSDSYRITTTKMDSIIDDELFIPVDLLKFFNKSKPVKYAQDDNWIYFKDLQSTIVCMRKMEFDEEWANLQEIINSVSDAHEIELPEKLYDSLEKSTVVLSNKYEADNYVSINCRKGKLILNAKGSVGAFKDVLRIDFDDNIQFNINPKFLMDILEKNNKIEIDENCMKINFNNSTFLTVLADSE